MHIVVALGCKWLKEVLHVVVVALGCKWPCLS